MLAWDTVKHALFQVGSVMTTTGYSTTDFDLWPSFSKGILFTLMFVGQVQAPPLVRWWCAAHRRQGGETGGTRFSILGGPTGGYQRRVIPNRWCRSCGLLASHIGVFGVGSFLSAYKA